MVMFKKELETINNIFDNAVEELKKVCERFPNNTIITDDECKNTIYAYIWLYFDNYELHEKHLKAIGYIDGQLLLYLEGDEYEELTLDDLNWNVDDKQVYNIYDSDINLKATMLSIMASINDYLD